MRVQLVTLTRWSMTVCQRRVCGSRSRNRIRMGVRIAACGFASSRSLTLRVELREEAKPQAAESVGEEVDIAEVHIRQGDGVADVAGRTVEAVFRQAIAQQLHARVELRPPAAQHRQHALLKDE